MSQVLLLTKNCLADMQFQQDLQTLNFDVFCSCSVLELLNYKLDIKELVRFFKIVILSESLSEAEVAVIVPQLDTYDVAIVRKDHQAPDEAKQAKWKQLGIDEWLAEADSIVDIREKLATAQKRTGTNIIEFSSLCSGRRIADSGSLQRTLSFETKLPPNFLEELKGEFSEQEQTLFNALLVRQNVPLTREEICDMLWPAAEVEHKLAQISIIIRNMKKKIAGLGFTGESIRTRRGVGYVLCQSFYELLAEADAATYFQCKTLSR